MEEKKHIDRLFQEKLKDFEIQPNPEVWNAIEQQLMKKKKRRIVPLWLRLGAAAAILLLVSVGVWFFSENQNSEETAPQTPIVFDKIEKTTNPTQDDAEVVTRSEIDGSSIDNTGKDGVTNQSVASSKMNPKKNTSSETSNKIIDTSIEQRSLAENKELDTEKSKEEIPVKAQNDKFGQLTDNKTTEIAKNDTESLKNDIIQAIEENAANNVKTTVDGKIDRWYVGPVVAPIQYNSFTGGSPISKSLASNDKKSNTTLSYGLKVNYKFNDRLSIQSGVNSVDLSYRTQDVTAFVFSNQLSFSSNLSEQTNIDGSNAIVVSGDRANTANTLAASRGAAVTLNGDLNQSISYVEVPLEAKYALTKTRLGIHLVGGVSTYILNDNSVSLQNFDGTKSLGQASNINNVNFSTNLGLDLDYKFSKKIFFNISPMFKYQLNTFTEDDGGFNPYFLGVYTGLNFRF